LESIMGDAKPGQRPPDAQDTEEARAAANAEPEQEPQAQPAAQSSADTTKKQGPQSKFHG
jgi:hypothetical protein